MKEGYVDQVNIIKYRLVEGSYGYPLLNILKEAQKKIKENKIIKSVVVHYIGYIKEIDNNVCDVEVEYENIKEEKEINSHIKKIHTQLVDEDFWQYSIESINKKRAAYGIPLVKVDMDLISVKKEKEKLNKAREQYNPEDLHWVENKEKTFGELDKETQQRFKDAFESGCTIQFRNESVIGWTDTAPRRSPAWIGMNYYRVKPREKSCDNCSNRSMDNRFIVECSECLFTEERIFWKNVKEKKSLPFGKLPKEYQDKIKEAYLQGKIIQFKSFSQNWNDIIGEPPWNNFDHYRIKPGEEEKEQRMITGKELFEKGAMYIRNSPTSLILKHISAYDIYNNRIRIDGIAWLSIEKEISFNEKCQWTADRINWYSFRMNK